MNEKLAASLVVILVTAVPDVARAECDARRDIGTCLTSDALWPRAGPHRFAFIANAETTPPESFDLGLFSSYQHRPIVLRVPTPGPPGTDTYPVEDQLNSTLVASFGAHRRLAFFGAIPWTDYQSGTDNSGFTGGKSLPSATLRDPRVGAAVSLLPPTPDGPYGSFAVAFLFDTQLPTGSTSDFAGERGVVFAPSIVGQGLFGRRLRAGVELDGRIRPVPRTFAGQRQGTQLFAGIGVSVEVVRDLFALGVEARPMLGVSGRLVGPATSNRSEENVFGGEWLVFARSAFPGPFGVLLGGGGGLPFDDFLGIPTARMVLALDYSPTPTKRTSGTPSQPPTATTTPPTRPALPQPEPPLPPADDIFAAPSAEHDVTVAASPRLWEDAPTSAASCSLRCKADPAAPLTEAEEAALANRIQHWFGDVRACFPTDVRPWISMRFGKGGVFVNVQIDDTGDSTCTAAQRGRLPRVSASHRALVRCEETCP